MEALYLDVQPRDLTMNANNLRMNNLIIAEYYGKGVENKSFQIDYQSFRKVFRIAGKNSVIILKDGDKEINVLVGDVQRHPVTDNFMHIDFIHVDMEVKVKAAVKLSFVGMAPAVKNLSGTLSVHLHKVEFECLPKDLIHELEVPIDSLVDFHSSIKVSDLNVPKGVVLLHDSDDIVALVSPPRGEEVADVDDESADVDVEETAEEAKGA